MNTHRIITGDCITGMNSLPECSIHTCITSPPYFGLRSYGGGDAEIGQEETVDGYVDKMTEVFRAVRRILRDDGTVWLNLGDSYMAAKNVAPPPQTIGGQRGMPSDFVPPNRRDQKGLKGKDLIGIPWRVAFALQADGWYLRQDIIWCLSGGSQIYVKTPRGHKLMMIRELMRLDPSTIQLWNGDKWTQLLGMSKSSAKRNELELVLRSGQRICCTPNHKFPTNRGLLEASEIVVGDCLQKTSLPEPESPLDCSHVGLDAAWFAGLYIAEGSMSEDTIQISGHIKEHSRWERIKKIAKDYGGSCTRSDDGNKMNIRVYGHLLVAILKKLVSGKTAKTKCLSHVCWNYSNSFLRELLAGYLSGDGHWDSENNRWRLGFCRNYNLERDLRVLSARLGFELTLLPSTSTFEKGGKEFPSFRGEIRFEQKTHKCNREEVVNIRKSRCREVYDLGVQDEPHLFALSSGVLTHNSKPNPMPESVEDRCTKAHEYIFLLSKKPRYYYDHEAIKEPARNWGTRDRSEMRDGTTDPKLKHHGLKGKEWEENPLKNKRSVWTVNTRGYKGAHFAVYPEDLITPCVLAGTSAHGCCSKCGAPYEREIERIPGNSIVCPKTVAAHEARGGKGVPVGTVGKSGGSRVDGYTKTLGWKPTCDCNANVSPCVVFDPFTGSGTTAVVALKHGRNYIGTELNPDYVKIAEDRIRESVPQTLDEMLS